MRHSFWLKQDKLQEECGVFAIFNHKNAAYLTMLGLHALQHRGQDSVGIISYDKAQLYKKKALGTVLSNFDESEILKTLLGCNAIGHTRYSTKGNIEEENIQPFFIQLPNGKNLSLAHNGQLITASHLSDTKKSDSHLITHILLENALKQEDIITAFKNTINTIQGGFAIVAINENIILAARDPVGIRPLIMGMIDGSPVFCSETCALDIIGAKFIREIENGEIICCQKSPDGSIETIQIQKKAPATAKLCIFEYIYFARDDSKIQGQSVYSARKRMGEILSKETHHIAADMVIPVQHSGTIAALGYANHSKLPFELAISASPYAGRSFIAPTSELQSRNARLKHNINIELIAGKNVIIVDDSIVRGTTLKHIVTEFRKAKATGIHIRIASPIIFFPDYFGVNIPSQRELLSSKYPTPAEIAQYLGADSVAFLSLNGLYHAICGESRNKASPQFTDHYFSGDYPAFYKNVLFSNKIHNSRAKT